MLGNLDDPTQEQMNQIHKALKKNIKKQKKTKNTIKQYSDVNNKLANGFKVSLNVIVDLSKVLKNYHYFLDEINVLLESMDKTYDDKANTINNLKSLTDEAINKLNLNFNDQLTEILEAYEKNSLDDDNLKDLKNILEKKNI
tara:strand:+ start:9151 stop:9576 length:426 start_codon:yes stop_codon:yes gene_type:complete